MLLTCEFARNGESVAGHEKSCAAVQQVTWRTYSAYPATAADVTAATWAIDIEREPGQQHQEPSTTTPLAGSRARRPLRARPSWTKLRKRSLSDRMPALSILGSQARKVDYQ